MANAFDQFDAATDKANPFDQFDTPNGSGAAPKKSTAQTEGTALDVAKSLPTGVLEGAATVVGLPGDLEHGLTWVMDKITGATPEEKKKREEAMLKLPLGELPTSEDIAGAIAKPFGGLHKPETAAGRYIETAGSFAPAALLPGSAALRAARVAVPAALSEAGGHAMKGTALEGPARMAGALLGGGITEGTVAGMDEAAHRAANRPQTIDQLKDTAQKLYEKAEKDGVIITKKSWQTLVSDVKKTIANEGVDQTLHPKALAAFKRLQDIPGNVTLKGIDILRRVVNDAAASTEKSERRIARIIRDKIDDYVDKIGPKDVIGKDPTAAANSLKSARTTWSRMAKGEMIESLIDKAKNRSNFTGSGFENALRTEFRKVAQNDRAMRRFSKDEQDAILKVVRGGPMENAFRFIGRFAPQNILHSMGAAALGAEVGGTTGAILAPAVGAGGRAVATALTKRNAELAAETARRGAPLPPSGNTVKSHVAPVALGAVNSRGRGLDYSLEDAINNH